MARKHRSPRFVNVARCGAGNAAKCSVTATGTGFACGPVDVAVVPATEESRRMIEQVLMNMLKGGRSFHAIVPAWFFGPKFETLNPASKPTMASLFDPASDPNKVRVESFESRFRRMAAAAGFKFVS